MQVEYVDRVAPNETMKCDAIHTICLRVINSDNNVQKVSKIITFLQQEVVRFT